MKMTLIILIISISNVICIFPQNNASIKTGEEIIIEDETDLLVTEQLLLPGDYAKEIAYSEVINSGSFPKEISKMVEMKKASLSDGILVEDITVGSTFHRKYYYVINILQEKEQKLLGVLCVDALKREVFLGGYTDLDNEELYHTIMPQDEVINYFLKYVDVYPGDKIKIKAVLDFEFGVHCPSNDWNYQIEIETNSKNKSTDQKPVMYYVNPYIFGNLGKKEDPDKKNIKISNMGKTNRIYKKEEVITKSKKSNYKYIGID